MFEAKLCYVSLIFLINYRDKKFMCGTEFPRWKMLISEKWLQNFLDVESLTHRNLNDGVFTSNRMPHLIRELPLFVASYFSALARRSFLS